MDKLKQQDRDKLSRILHNNWDNIFKFLTDSGCDEENIPYREVYKWELSDREKEFPDLIDIYLENDSFFDRGSVRNWLIQEIVGALLCNADCRSVKFHSCVNQLYDQILTIIRPYYKNLFPEKHNTIPLQVIETNISMKDGKIYDHQSRAVEVDTWDEYVKVYKEYDGMAVNAFRPITNMNGCSIPSNVEILNLVYDEHHLSCDLRHQNGWIDKKLAYRCKPR